MRHIEFENVDITDGFWKSQQDTARKSTIYSVYNRFKDTGRFDAIKMNWKEGEPNRPHVYWDSDVAKWIEALAYLNAKEPCPDLIAKADEMIDDYAEHQLENGYINSAIAYLDKANIFNDRANHELYTIGHLTEAAIAYDKFTGKSKFLSCMEKCLDLVYNVFIKYDAANFVTPGHEEIELALLKLYRYTKCEKYLEMAKFFIDKRGEDDKTQRDNPGNPKYSQSHLPVRKQKTAEGHAVRAVYLYTAMADLASEIGDKELLSASEAIFENIVNKKMYITGGIGSASNEAFTVDYDLPNITSYTESCAAIGLMLFASRLQLTSVNSLYGDIIEKILYNGFLSAKTLDGKAFFYENPLEIPPAASKVEGVHYPITHRLEVFKTSCCPPNISRFLASVGSYIYSEDKGVAYIHQFMTSKVKIDTNGKNVKLSQSTNYPTESTVTVKCEGGDMKCAIRVPSWSGEYSSKTVNGYLYFELSDGEERTFDFKAQPRFVCSNPNVLENIGRAALTYGPLVFCLEGVDNGELLRSLRFNADANFECGYDEQLGVITFKAEAERQLICTELYYTQDKRRYEKVEAKFIPYYAFANRGDTEMLVFVNIS